MRPLILVLAAMLVFGRAGPACAEPRAVVGRVADVIAQEFFDAAKGAEIATGLKAEAARGTFDRYAAPLDLAQALTARLRPMDPHFAVAWREPQDAPPAAVALRAAADAREASRRSNYGVRAVEVLPGNLGLIDLRSFAHFEAADAPARAAADAALAVVANADAVIFDLRDNGGGSPAMVGYLAAHFVPAGAEVFNVFRSRDGTESEKPPVEPRTRRLDVPLFILTSARTGSAAESFAYTLQAAKRAVVVGEATAGAANPGDVYPLGEGFTVFVSNGAPVNPITGGNWGGTGVKPDVAAPSAQARVRAQQLALEALAGRLREPARTEVRWALEALGPAAAVSARTLAGYAGAYGIRTVAVEGGRLLVRQERRPPQALKPLSQDLFAIDRAAIPVRVRFERNPAGRITGMVQMTADGRMTRYARD